MGNNLKNIEREDFLMENNNEKTIDEVMEQMTKNLILQAEKKEPGSDNQLVLINTALRVHKAWLDSAKTGVEYQDRADAREHEIELKKLDYQQERQMRMIDSDYELKRRELDEKERLAKEKDQAKQDKLHMAVDVGKAFIPVIGIVLMTKQSWAQEEKGLVLTSQASKTAVNLLSKLIR